MCFFLCSDDPIENDTRKDNAHRFTVGMMEAPRADPGCCLAACLCPCCAQIVMRRKALNKDMTQYTCCQGYMDGIVPCVKSGQCGEHSCPNFCLCMESFCCNGCAVSSTRMMVMDRYSLQPDKWDNRIIRFNNCMQLTSIICQCLAICIPNCDDLADAVTCLAQCTYASTQGCMTAQINVEIDRRAGDIQPVTYTDMDRV